jgi:hypothetical protein
MERRPALAVQAMLAVLGLHTSHVDQTGVDLTEPSTDAVPPLAVRRVPVRQDDPTDRGAGTPTMRAPEAVPLAGAATAHAVRAGLTGGRHGDEVEEPTLSAPVLEAGLSNLTDAATVTSSTGTTDRGTMAGAAPEMGGGVAGVARDQERFLAVEGL